MTEFMNRTAGQAKTTDPVIAPVTASDLADYLVLDASDPVLDGILVAATSAVVRFLGYDLVARDWTLTHWDWPTRGTTSLPTLSGQNGCPKREIRLPYANLMQVYSVELYGEAETDFVARAESIVLGDTVVRRDIDGENDSPAIVVSYQAGYGETDDEVPGEIKQAVMMLAAFMYEHRGACDAGNALMDSGAVELLRPWRNPELLV